MAWVFDRSNMLPGAQPYVEEWIEALGDLEEFAFEGGCSETHITLYDAMVAIALHALHDLGIHTYQVPREPKAA